jgi:Na+/proline symporter
MIGYILLIILCAGAWTLLGFGVKRDTDWQVVVGVIFGVITTVLFMLSTIGISTKYPDAASFKNNRDYQQELIYSISDTMSPQTISNIVASATYINERIERNQKHCDSKMWGFMYNKEIAEVEPIDIPKIKYQITIEENVSEE